MGVDSSQVYRLAGDLAAAPAKATVGSGARGVPFCGADPAGRAEVRPGPHRSPSATGHRGHRRGLSSGVVSTVRYADYVEFGTSDTAPQPYMRPPPTSPRTR
jgi:hypothetical protein